MYWMQEVGITKTNAVLRSPVVKYIRLPATLKDGRILIHCPRYPGGIFPGVFGGGIPLLKPRDLKPYPRERRYA